MTQKQAPQICKGSIGSIGKPWAGPHRAPGKTTQETTGKSPKADKQVQIQEYSEKNEDSRLPVEYQEKVLLAQAAPTGFHEKPILVYQNQLAPLYNPPVYAVEYIVPVRPVVYEQTYVVQTGPALNSIPVHPTSEIHPARQLSDQHHPNERNLDRKHSTSTNKIRKSKNRQTDHLPEAENAPNSIKKSSYAEYGSQAS